MSTRRPKVPQARTAGGGSAGGGPAPAASEPDTITATKSAGGTAAEAKPSAKPAAKAAKPAATSAAKPSAKPSAKPAGTPAGTPAAKPAAKAKQTAASKTKARTSRFRLAPRKPAAGTDTGPVPPDPSDDLRPVPAKTFSGRLLVLAMVTAVITVLLAPSVSTYLQQRSEIAALEADIAAQEESAQELQAQLDRWADPNYIKQQARERIFLVMPGETRYLVKGEHGVENVEQQAQEEATDLQWVDALWDSVARSAAAQ